VNELQEKLRSRRKEKASWQQAAVELRGEVNDANAMLKAQKKILGDCQHNLFTLQNIVEENAPKVALADEYKKRMDDLTKMQILWDDSDERREFKRQKADMEHVQSRLNATELLVESLKHANEQLVDTVNSQRSHIISLESRLARSPSPSIMQSPSTPRLSFRGRRQSFSPPQPGSPGQGMSASTTITRLNQLEEEITSLRAKNFDLEEEAEELKAMVEVLRLEGGPHGTGGVRNVRSADDLALGRRASMMQSQSPFRPGLAMDGPSPLLSPVALADLMQATDPADSFSLAK